ncbi:MAG: hypothetical protein ABFR95_09440 [Actinomycetota bacterium]
MVASSLRDDLLGIPGVEGAEFDGSQDSPAGLRIRIAEGADQSAVGGAIRRVLSSHGLGTDTRLPGEPQRLAGSGEDAGGVDVLTVEDSDIEGSIIDITDKGLAAGTTDEPHDLPPFIEPRVPRPKTIEDEPAPELTIARIDRVRVEEGRSGIVVTVASTDGAEASQAAMSSEGGVEAAVVKAAAKLVNPDMPDPIVIDIEDRRVEGVDIVMIVLDADGELVSGSAVVAAGRPFALGRATWAALSF